MRRSEVVVDGVRSPVLETGAQGASEAVVFVHGNPGGAADWTSLMNAIAPFGRTVALDMPGFAGADRPESFEYTISGYARHLAGALDQLGVQRAHLVLHDFGGPWGLAWAVDHPDRHRSTTLINTGVFVRYRWHAMARVWRTPVLGEASFRIMGRRALGLLMRSTNPASLPDDFVDRLVAHYADRGTVRAVLQLYRATETADWEHRLAPALREHPRPTRVIWGAQDPYLPLTLAHRQSEVFRESEVIELTGSGHWPHEDAPGAVEAAIVPWLREQLAAA